MSAASIAATPLTNCFLDLTLFDCPPFDSPLQGYCHGHQDAAHQQGHAHTRRPCVGVVGLGVHVQLLGTWAGRERVHGCLTLYFDVILPASTGDRAAYTHHKRDKHHNND